MKIEHLHIENYRCFGDLFVNLDGQLTVLVGVNGSGKTTILDALVPFLRIYGENFCSDPESKDISTTNLKLGANSIELSCIIDGKSIALSFQPDEKNNNHLKFLARGNYLRKIEKPFSAIAYYTSKRILGAYNDKEKSRSGQMYAYVKAFSPQIDFSSSLAWFIEKATQEALEATRLKDFNHKIPELSAVRLAISKALGEYSEPYVGETPPKLFITPKNHPEQAYNIEQLSDGYRTMLALVMDLARRMAVANEQVVWSEGQTVLHSPGIVLIDEVELHLHPSWQQTVLPSLMDIFPNVQFIVTTHSPQVLTSIPAKHIRVLKDGRVFTLPDNEETEGADAARILEDVLGVNPRPIPNYFAKELNRYAEMVYSEKWDSPEAEKLRQILEKHYRGSEPKLQELELHIENSKWERGL